MAEDTIMLPKVEELQLDGKLKTSFPEIKAKLSKLPFYDVGSDANSVTAAKVESRNIDKAPYLFHIVKISSNSIDISYSIIPDTSESMRRAYVVKNLAGILSLINNDYEIDVPKFMQYIDSTLGNLIDGISQNYNLLYNKYDSLASEYREIKRLNNELEASNKNITVQITQLSEENKELKEELDKLKKYSDEALMGLVQEWVEVHDNSIDTEQFAKNYAVSIPRVEQILNKMVMQGYLEVKS